MLIKPVSILQEFEVSLRNYWFRMIVAPVVDSFSLNELFNNLLNATRTYAN